MFAILSVPRSASTVSCSSFGYSSHTWSSLPNQCNAFFCALCHRLPFLLPGLSFVSLFVHGQLHNRAIAFYSFTPVSERPWRRTHVLQVGLSSHPIWSCDDSFAHFSSSSAVPNFHLMSGPCSAQLSSSIPNQLMAPNILVTSTVLSARRIFCCIPICVAPRHAD